MRFLPKVNPLYEKIAVTKVVIPDVLDKLGKGGFTGYLNYSANGFEAYCVFAKGNLICAFSAEGNREKTGFEAIAQMFDKVFTAGGEINVYRMTADLAMCSQALLLGARLYNGDEVRQVDIKSMMSRLKGQSLNGVLHFYTPEHYGMMFYKDGLPIGFYHDGGGAIEPSSEEVRKVAALAGAKVDVCSTKPIEELLHYDLLQMVNLVKLWESARSRHASTLKPERDVTESDSDRDKRFSGLVEDIAEVASAYLSKEGRTVIEKALNSAGGSSFLLDAALTETFLNQVEADARVIDSHARIDEMIDLMRSEIAGRLAV